MKQERENEKNEISRRTFLGGTGKLVGLGILTHFAMLGRVNGAEIQPFTQCTGTATNSCTFADEYTCQEDNKHSCNSRFNCMNRFTCNPHATNDCGSYSQNNCNPERMFNRPE